jgi:hypothetical protein
MNSVHEKSAFAGRITASVTHEIQNVLAIIKESSGLMEDILAMNPDSVPDQRIGKCIDSIKRQAYRGVTLTSALNGFAHTADHPVSRVNVCGILEELVFLTRRIFTQQGHRVTFAGCDTSFGIETDPVLFQMVLFRTLECLSEIPDVKSPLVVTVFFHDHLHGIKFAHEDSRMTWDDFCAHVKDSALWAEVHDICHLIGITAEMIPPGGLLLHLAP